MEDLKQMAAKKDFVGKTNSNQDNLSTMNDDLKEIRSNYYASGQKPKISENDISEPKQEPEEYNENFSATDFKSDNSDDQLKIDSIP